MSIKPLVFLLSLLTATGGFAANDPPQSGSAASTRTQTSQSGPRKPASTQGTASVEQKDGKKINLTDYCREHTC